MEIIYRADDGTEFEEYYKCEAYEKVKEAKDNSIIEQIHIFDADKDEVEIDVFMFETAIMEAYYVKFDSEEAAEFFNEQQYNYGYAAINKFTKLKANEVYCYDNADEAWSSITEQRIKLDEIEQLFRVEW